MHLLTNRSLILVDGFSLSVDLGVHSAWWNIVWKALSMFPNLCQNMALHDQSQHLRWPADDKECPMRMDCELLNYVVVLYILLESGHRTIPALNAVTGYGPQIPMEGRTFFGRPVGLARNSFTFPIIVERMKNFIHWTALINYSYKNE